MDHDIEPHSCVTETAKFVALTGVASRLICLNAKAVHVSGHRVDFAGEARYPEGVDDVLARDQDVDRRTRGHVQDILGLYSTMIGIAEGPGPLLTNGLDRQRCMSR